MSERLDPNNQIQWISLPPNIKAHIEGVDDVKKNRFDVFGIGIYYPPVFGHFDSKCLPHRQLISMALFNEAVTEHRSSAFLAQTITLTNNDEKADGSMVVFAHRGNKQEFSQRLITALNKVNQILIGLGLDQIPKFNETRFL